MLCGTFLLVVGSHGEQSLFLLHHDEVRIFVENLQHRMTEFVVMLFPAHLHFHARLEGIVVLRLDVVVHHNHAVGQQSLHTCAADACHLLYEELHQFRRFGDRIDRISGGSPRKGTPAVCISSCHFVYRNLGLVISWVNTVRSTAVQAYHILHVVRVGEHVDRLYGGYLIFAVEQLEVACLWLDCSLRRRYASARRPESRR